MILVLSMVGGYTLRSNWVDVITVLLLGFFGYIMVRKDYSIIAFVLGVVLGPIAEENLMRSLPDLRGLLRHLRDRAAVAAHHGGDRPDPRRTVR